MPDTTLTINHAGGGSETYTINRDKFEGIRTMTRKLSETAGDPENITSFNATFGGIGWDGTFVFQSANNRWFKGIGEDVTIQKSTIGPDTGKWLVFSDYDWEEESTSLTSDQITDYPWEVTSWTVKAGDEGTPDGNVSFSNFVGGSLGNVVTDTVSVDHTPPEDLRNLLIDAENITINRDKGEEFRTLFIDGVEVTIDRTGEIIVQRLLDLFTGAAAAYSLQSLKRKSDQALINVRRGSDNVEVDVYPDNTNNREVSADSPITVTSGSSSATTLGEFIVPPSIQALYNQRAYFDGANDYVSLPNLGISGSDNRTVVVKGIYQSQLRLPLFTINGLSTAAGERWSFLADNDSLRIEIQGSGSNTGLSLPDGKEFFVAIKLDGSTLGDHRLFANGVFENASGGNTVNTTDKNYFIGRNLLSYGVGSLYDVEVYDTALSDSDIEALYADESISTAPIASYEGYGNTNADWKDQVGSNNGTVNGSPALFTGQGFSATVTTWYDQSGNNNDASQLIDDAQPKIAENGSVLAEGGKPTLRFDGADDTLEFASTFPMADTSIFAVNKDTGGNFSSLIGGRDGSPNQRTLRTYSANNWRAVNTTDGFDFYNGGKLFVNGQDGATTGFSAANLNLVFAYDSNFPYDYDSISPNAQGRVWDGIISEVIIYNSDQSANRADIEANINERYSIY